MLNTDQMASALGLCADVFTYPNQEYFNKVKQLGILTQNSILIDCSLLSQNDVETEYIKSFSLAATSYKTVPLASWWLDGKMMGKHYIDIERFYQSCGFVIDSQTVALPHDHISLMLSFLSILLEDHRVAEAQEFAENYMNWLGSFYKELQVSSPIALFSETARVAQNLIGSLKASYSK